MFAHLHVASHHSVHYGTARPAALVEAVAQSQSGTPIAALTDRDTLAGAIRHIRACIEHGVGPAIGAELLVDEGSAPASTITVLAHGHDEGHGWAAVSRLVSSAHMRRRRHKTRERGTETSRPSVTRSAIRSLLTGEDQQSCATVVLGPGSDIGQSLLKGDHAGAAAQLKTWQRTHPDIVLEAVCHFTQPGMAASLGHAAAIAEFGEAHHVPVILTNAVRYLEPDDATTADLLDAVGLLTPLGEITGQPNDQAWLKPEAKLEKTLRMIIDHSTLSAGTFHDIRSATNRLAERCVLDPDGDIGWRKPKLPELSMIGLSDDDSPQSVLAGRARAAVAHRYPHASLARVEAIHDRLSHELGIIESFGFGSYFLTVAHVVDLIHGMGVRVQGRGSGAGSLVNHLLGISPVDPIEHGLLFERFLGKARSTLPDIDIDVESARRHEIYQRILTEYGGERVTLLSMANRYRGRGAVRDAGLALGLPEDTIDLVAKHVWRINARELPARLAQQPELAPVAEMAAADSRITDLINLAARLDRMPRHLSMHPCGVIVSDADLLSLTPVQPSGIENIAMSQFDKDDMDDLGLLKLDVLGVRMQSTIAHTLEQIQVTHGTGVARAGGLSVDAPYVSKRGVLDIEAIPRDDEETFEAIRSTHTLGMFQIESPGQRELLGRLQPDRYDDLIADIALFRPGPMQGNMVTPFLNAKHHPRRRRWLHPLLREATEDAYGTVIFHEHVMHILSTCMDIGLAESDELRRKLGKPEHLGEIEVAFRGATRSRSDDDGSRIFTDRQIDSIWSVIAGFGSFGFCKAHGAAFAITTWQTAWLKTHFPAEFMAGLLEHDPGMYPKRLLVAEARRLGVPVLPVDVTRSGLHVVVERLRATPAGQRTRAGDLGVRLPLVGIRGMSGTETERILDTRPHRDIHDLLRRAKPARPTAEHLAAIGALDALAPGFTRGQVIALVKEHFDAARAGRGPGRAAVEVPGQGSLDFSFTPTPRGLVSEPSAVDQVATDLHTLGIETAGHALDTYRDLLAELGVTDAGTLADLPNRSEVLVAGVRVATQTPPMRSGDRVVFISVDDGTGVADAAFFGEAQEAAGPVLFNAKLLLIAGTTRLSGARGLSITATNAWRLDDLARERTAAQRQQVRH